MTQLLETIELETGRQPTASVIWLHGLGADGHDFEAIVPELELPAVPIRFIFPHAPMQPVTINAGMVMRAWYDVTDAAIRREDEAGVRASQARIEALMAREKERGTRSDRLLLAGFSQGGAIALQTGLRHRERLAGIMALSCYLPLADRLATEAQAANRDIPIFMAHGTEDPVVALARAAESRDLLRREGYALEWHDYRMPHSVCLEEIRDIGAWLRRVLS
ncbi:MAG: carboxylesterase [Betaproteobacteria bacterium RIFCSPLOWO2_12_FULL_63_13]|nr:MAG: carboxylesterase [Betaproteobacteria bacterium RIFCSPLOWO2_02_FULL_63_19]OGA44555.1 MAG: carboxylesterase [Betaproteobacteria bacterium RIFCSPLOWO2_12_FULL_63_13]